MLFVLRLFSFASLCFLLLRFIDIVVRHLLNFFLWIWVNLDTNPRHPHWLKIIKVCFLITFEKLLEAANLLNSGRQAAVLLVCGNIVNVCRIKLYEIFINFILKHFGFKSAIQIRFPCFLSDILYSFLLMPDLSSVLLQQYLLKLTFFGLTCFFLCQHLGESLWAKHNN